MRRLIYILLLAPLLLVTPNMPSQWLIAGPAANTKVSWKNTNYKYVAGTASNSVNGITLPAFTLPLTPGSLEVCTVQLYSGSTVSSLVDTGGYAYIDSGAGAVPFHSSAQYIQVFYLLNTHSTASNHPVVTFSSPSKYAGLFCAEFTGNAPSGVVDVYQSAANQTTSVSGGANQLVIPSQNTVVSGDLIWAAWGTSLGYATVGTSPNAFTGFGISNMVPLSEYFVQTTAGAIAPTAGDTGTGTEYWSGIMVAFKP